MAKISVVVAIYGVEKYLEKCLDSIINQTYRDIEIILVDDGSTDMCPQICDRYSKEDDRIKVIHQQNQGANRARGNGAAIATGEYVSFVDGDDWLQDNMYETLNELAEKSNADVVVTGYYQGYEGNLEKKINNIDSGEYFGEDLNEVQSKILFFGKFYEAGIVPALWNKLFRKDLLGDIFDRVDPIIKMGDDAAITYPLLDKARVLVIQNEIFLYCYRNTPNSMSKVYDEAYFVRAYSLIKSLYTNLKDGLLEKQIIYYMLFIYKIGIEQAIGINRKIRLTRRLKVLKDSIADFNFFIADRDIEWSGIDKYDYDLICSYRNGSFFRLMYVYYRHLIWKV